MFVGIILCPFHLRDPILDQYIGGNYSRINYFLVLALLLLMITKKDYTKWEVILCVIWLLLLVPLWFSNIDYKLPRTLSAVTQTWLPVYLIIQRIDEDKRKKYLRNTLFVYDVFIAVLLSMGVYERLTGHSILHVVIQWLDSMGIRASEYLVFSRQVGGFEKSVGSRMYSLWGHPLTNAILFTSFFILNDIYFRSVRQRYPKMIFFAVAAVGVLLCVGKTATVVLALCLVISNWKNPRWLIAYAALGALLYFMGAFDTIIQRFTAGEITTGRIPAIIKYFSGDNYPLRAWIGYGAGTTYLADMRHLSPAFEFPLLMYALDNGILFSLVYVGSMFGYLSYHFLSRRQISTWMMISLLFAQIQTYNGMSLRNQDIGWLNAIIIMIAINSVLLTDQPDPPKRRRRVQEKGIKAALMHLICGEDTVARDSIVA